MGKNELLIILHEQRKISNKWFTSSELKETLKTQGASEGVIRRADKDLMKLCLYGLIDYRGVGIWKHSKEFRGKREEE